MADYTSDGYTTVAPYLMVNRAQRVLKVLAAEPLRRGVVRSSHQSSNRAIRIVGAGSLIRAAVRRR